MRNLCWLTMLAITLATIAPVVRIMPSVAADPPSDAPAASSTKPPDRTEVDIEQEVRRLLKELAGDIRTQRVDAERQLLALGPRALPHLPAPELLPSNSVREAVRRIRLELERVAALQSIQPSEVNMNANSSLATTLDDITKQTGNRIISRSLPDETLRKITGIETESIRFWPTLDLLAAQHNLRYANDAGLAGLELLPRDPAEVPTENVHTYAGAFRLEAPPAVRSQRAVAGAKDVRLAGRPDLLRVTLWLRSEPRLRPLFLRFAAKDVTVLSPDKIALAPLTPEANVELALHEGAGQSRIQMDYVVPPSMKVPSVDIQGKLQCTTAAGNEVIRFTDLTKLADGREVNIARRRGGVTVALNRVAISRAAGGKKEMQIKVAVAYDTGGPAFETHRSWMLHNEVYLEGPTGQRLPLNGGTETTQQGASGLGIIYRFTGLPEDLPDYTFVYVAPTLIVDVPIEFHLKSVPVHVKP